METWLLSPLSASTVGCASCRVRLLTVLDIAGLDLLCHLGPDGGVALLVLGDALGLQLDDLLEAAARVALPPAGGGRGHNVEGRLEGRWGGGWRSGGGAVGRR